MLLTKNSAGGEIYPRYDAFGKEIPHRLHFSGESVFVYRIELYLFNKADAFHQLAQVLDRNRSGNIRTKHFPAKRYVHLKHIDPQRRCRQAWINSAGMVGKTHAASIPLAKKGNEVEAD